MIRNAKRALAMAIAAISMVTGSLNVMATPVTEFTPERAQACTLDSVTTVEITDQQKSKWFKFTAPEDGTYAFFTSMEFGNESDPYLLLYDDDVCLINFNDDAGEDEFDFNAYVSCVMTSGETVYIQATLDDYDTNTGSYELHIAKGLAFYWEYDGGRYYSPWIGDSLVTNPHDSARFCFSGDLQCYISDGTGAAAEYMGGSMLFEDIKDAYYGVFDVDFSIGSYDFHRKVVFGLTYQITMAPRETSGVEGTQHIYMMVDPGDSFELEDSAPWSSISYGLRAFYYNTGSEMHGIADAVTENGRQVIRHSFESIDEYTYIWMINEDQFCYSEKDYHIFVSEENVPEMDIDTDYTVEWNGVRVGHQIYSFTPRLTGSYTFSLVNYEQGSPNISIFNEDNELIAHKDYELFHHRDSRNDQSDSLRYAYYHYGAQYPEVNEERIDYGVDIADGDLTLDLVAGHTYQVAFDARTVWYHSADYDIRITCNENVPYPTASPTPTSAPTSAPTAQPTTSPVIDEPITGTVVPATNYSIGDFVERLYTVALGRPSDPEGKQDWIDAVTLRGQTGADLARGFLYSPEFLQKNVSNEEFVRVLYRTFFNRDADPDGLAGWVAVLDNGGSKEGVIEGFINSTEWANLCLLYGVRSGGTGVPNIEVEPNQQTIDFATRLYTTCLGRAADQNGLRAWARQLANQRDTGTGAARGFFFSSEFTGQNVSNDEYVNRLYRTFMGREADEAGFNAWVAQLNEGVSREEVFEGFAQSPEFTGICASYGIIR